MASSRRKSSSSGSPLVLVGVLAGVVAVLGGAAWLLGGDDGDMPEDEGPIVQAPREEVRESGDLPEGITPAPVEQEVESLRPTSAPTASGQEIFRPEADATMSAMSGRVMTPDGQPVAGCELRVFKGNPLLMNVNFAGSRKLLPTRAVSRPDGTFRLEDIPAGRDYVLVGEHQDFARTELSGLQVPKDGERENVLLTLEMGAVVSGVVTTASGGPVAGARIELYDAIASVQLDPSERKPWKIVLSADDGSYAFEHVSATSLKLRVSAPGFEAQSRMLSFALEARASDRTVDFALREGIGVQGRVVDDRGRPVGEVRVEATSLTKDYQGTSLAFSDANGYFLLDGMNPEQYYQVRSTAEGYSNKVLPKVHPDEGEILIELERRLFVEGSVATLSGQPVRQFKLTLMRAAEGRDPLFLNDSRPFESNDGSFVFDNLDPGSYALEAKADGYAPAWSEPFIVSRAEADVAPRVDIALGRGGRLTGQVRDSRGQPVAGAKIKLNPNNHLDSPIQGIFAALGGTAVRTTQVRTNAEGRFALDNVRPAVYQVACTHQDSAPFSVNDVTVLDESVGTTAPLDIQLPAGAAVAGRAFDNNRRPLPFTEIQLTNKDTAYLDATTTDAEGRFEFSNLAEGQYSLMVKPDRVDGKPVNPLMKLMYAQRSQYEVFMSSGQRISDVELYLPDIPQG